MLLRTYQKIITIFREHCGYMSFSELQKYQVTVLQLRELEEEGCVERFARGWYWCSCCGYTKPLDYRYIEIAKLNPEAVICLDSACYLGGLLAGEPEPIAVATERTDRRRMELQFPVRRFYLQNTGIAGEICEIETAFGSYRYYAPERTLCDCVRMKGKLSEGVYAEILERFRGAGYSRERLFGYAKRLRAVRNLEEMLAGEGEDRL